MNYERTQIHQKKLSAYVKIGGGILLLFIWACFWVSWTGKTPVKLDTALIIPKGASVSTLPSTLKADVGGLRYKLWNIFYAPNITLKSGIFSVPEGTNTLQEVFIMLQNPTPTEEEIMILPGWHKGEISEEFKKHFIEGNLLTEEQTIITALAPKYPFLAGKTSLEGFLMPDTYRITGGTSVTTMVEKMLTNFNIKIYQPFLASGKPVDAFHDVLILASIVGEEEKSTSQIGVVAEILKKRLRGGWHIGADITVCYPDLIPGSECQKFVNNFYSLSQSVRKEKNNLYDTREIVGLPPTPIASITSDTFMVTLNAKTDTPAWYYLHDTKGIIHTATTDTEHEQNKTTYLR